MLAYGSVNAILPLVEHLENEGIDPATVLARAGVPRDALSGPRRRLPKEVFQRVWQAGIEVTGDPALALRVSTLVKPGTLGIVGYLASASESPRNAFELVRGLTPLLWERFGCDLDTRGDTALIRFDPGASPRASRFTIEYAVGLTVTMSRRLGPARSDPLEARLSYPAPDYAAQYGSILNLAVTFDAGEDGVLFPMSMLERANPAADPSLRRVLERHAAEELSRLPSHAAFAERVRASIRAQVPLRDLSLEGVAADLSMSHRTLRRRLREEATSYREILDEVRADLARHYLAREKRPIDEVAFLLGFSDQSAFTKAFRRWTDRTPAQYVRTAAT